MTSTGVDQSAGDQRRTGRLVADRRNQCVVLVAKVGVQVGSVAECSVRVQAGRVELWNAQPVRHDPCPSHRTRGSRRRAAKAQHAHVDARVEVLLLRFPPRPGQIGLLGNGVAHGSTIVGRQDRLGQHHRDSSAVRSSEPDRERQELDGRVGVRAAAVTTRATPSRLGRHLRQERRVSDHDVEPFVPPVAGERVVVDGSNTPIVDGADRRCIDVTAHQLGRLPECCQTVGDRHQEPAVTAGRVDNAQAAPGRGIQVKVIEHAVDSDADQLRRGVPGAPRLAGRLHRGHRLRIGCTACRSGTSPSTGTTGRRFERPPRSRCASATSIRSKASTNGSTSTRSQRSTCPSAAC